MSIDYIPLSVPAFIGNEKEYVNKALDEEWVSTAGSYIGEFETRLAQYLDVEETVACQSGTAGIHTALMVAGVEQGDEVIVPDMTFIATLNPVRYVGAEPVIMDIDRNLCLDPSKLEMFLDEQTYSDGEHTYNKKSRRRIRAVIVVHVFGILGDIGRICDICSDRNIKVIEDATEALGTYWDIDGVKRYAGTFADFGIFSYNGNKIITTGGGGSIVCKDSQDAVLAKHLTTQAKEDELFYIHDMVGYNYRMTNLQAALGLAQLEKLEILIDDRLHKYQTYLNGLKDIEGIEVLTYDNDIRWNGWLTTIRVNQELFGLDRNHLLKRLNQKKIGVRPVWGLMHRQKPFVNCQTYILERSIEEYDQLLNVPCSYRLNAEQQDYVIEMLKEAKC